MKIEVILIYNIITSAIDKGYILHKSMDFTQYMPFIHINLLQAFLTPLGLR